MRVIQGRAECGSRMNARYVAVAPMDPTAAACPDQNDRPRSVEPQPAFVLGEPSDWTGHLW